LEDPLAEVTVMRGDLPRLGGTSNSASGPGSRWALATNRVQPNPAGSSHRSLQANSWFRLAAAYQVGVPNGSSRCIADISINRWKPQTDDALTPLALLPQGLKLSRGTSPRAQHSPTTWLRTDRPWL